MNVTEEIRRELLGEFRQAARERLERIGAAWVALESEGTASRKEHSVLILRELHTLKGEAKLMGYATVSQLAHNLEDLMVALERGAWRRAPAVGDLVLKSVDALGAMVQLSAEEATARTDLETRLTTATKEATQTPVEQPAPAAGAPEPIGRDAFVRVDIATAQHLAEEASEAVVIQARYQHALTQLRMCSEELGAVMRARGRESLVPILGSVHAQLVQIIERLAEDIHAGETAVRTLELDARRLRLTSLAPLFRSHMRAVRELARDLGKQATLHIDDAGIAVDRQVVERLGAPLLHLLRNSVDHGLESPAARRAAGKPETGRINLTAERAGSDVVVAIEDDGGGVDVEAVRLRGIELGMLASGAVLDDRDVLGLLFTPGFSTRKRATETSGRGVGLDVVKTQIESLGGSVRMSTQRGQGTRFELRVPIDVALTRALIVVENGQAFAIPHLAVEAVLGVDGETIETIHTRRHIRHRDAWIPVVELAAALSLPAVAVSAEAMRAVVVRHEEHSVALLVDAWRGDAEVVIKPLGELATTRYAIGACTIAGGEVALVLSPSELVARALGEVPRIRLAERTSRKAAEQKVLLVEDSAITRTMIAQLLRMLGYHVGEAEDGARALRTLEEFTPDVVITDVEMPQMDGIELIRRLRADQRWRGLPVVVLSTRGSTEDKQRAVAVGADAYLVKTEFSETALRDVLARHLGKG
ncbi:MAG: response regulator [Kofleriaceae bacterium]|nr:response regulator [Kofleriaceae bacterium]